MVSCMSRQLKPPLLNRLHRAKASRGLSSGHQESRTQRERACTPEAAVASKCLVALLIAQSMTVCIVVCAFVDRSVRLFCVAVTESVHTLRRGLQLWTVDGSTLSMCVVVVLQCWGMCCVELCSENCACSLLSKKLFFTCVFLICGMTSHLLCHYCSL